MSLTVGQVHTAAMTAALVLAAANASAHQAPSRTLPDASWRWTFDPFVLVPLVATTVLYLCGAVRLARVRATGRRRIVPAAAVAFAAGVAATVAALASPLHALGDELFVAHMLQHEVLMLIAAPLMVLGRPETVMRAALPAPARRPLARLARSEAVAAAVHAATRPLVAAGLHGGVLWIWHAPALFAATLASDLVHALQHASFFGSALLFWWVVLEPHRARREVLVRTLVVFATSFHGALLGALLTVARTPWYPSYAASTAAYGLTPLEDQQLGGLVMWVPAGLVYVAAGLAIVARHLRELPPARELRPTWKGGVMTLFVGIMWLLSVAITPASGRAEDGAPTGRAYVSNERDGTISVIDTARDLVVATWSVTGRPRGIRLAPDGRRVLTAVSHAIAGGPPTAAEGIVALDARTGTIVARYAVGLDPEQFAITPDGGTLYVSNEDSGTATAIALPSGGTLATVVTGIEPEGVVASPDGTFVYVTAETSNTVTVVDTATHAVRSTFLVDPRPRDAAFTRDGAWAYVSAEIGGTVSIVDARRHEVVGTIAMPAGSLPAGVLVAPDQHTLYVANGRGNTVAFVDLAARKVAATVPVGQRTWGLGVTADGKKLYAANGLSNDVSVIDTSTRAVVATIAVGQGPWGIATTRR